MYFWTRSHKRRVRTKRFNGTRLTVLRPYGSGSELQTIVENVLPLGFQVSLRVRQKMSRQELWYTVRWVECDFIYNSIKKGERRGQKMSRKYDEQKKR
jgi:hypothetical protein